MVPNVVRLFAIAFLAAACSNDAPMSPDPPPPDMHVVGEPVSLRAIALATFESSGQVVHPDVAFPSGTFGRVPWLAITPYPWGNAHFENPSLFRATDGYDVWSVPNGVSNPIVRPSATGYLSDPDILWTEDTGELRLYYRSVTESNEIFAITSTDGARWSEPRSVLSAPNHQLVSPTVVRRGANEWLMWTVNAGTVGCGSGNTSIELRRSGDGFVWTSPVTVSLSQRGVFPWHLEVQWIPSRREYWALFNGKVPGSCTTDALYLATSADGITWRTYASPVLRRGAIPELNDIIYRATFAFDEKTDLVSLWHSGARHGARGYEWHAAFERRRRQDLFDAVGRTNATATFELPSNAPPLTNATAP